ncbi:hypothetical protein B484DRAFT_282819 [Ochromonadaceae sp. CCMP2298]|nr:hypothetical protein B484DRAFT_282819 [Ochromonadaceae sp. CCMP2298]|eukprot:CAMPEP_0173171086 /NCGR_PEP_ID=MMETSP1141-20130122/1575_1 /TAXON_ID=483371 /ORGANISM="non described non described, Strain CCMP2298" /LENGTH=345 /DNA_ID=CAMNT_0014093007 /DNA_START=50 /DNA_END=1087 /DNA_ORIENTATION=-
MTTSTSAEKAAPTCPAQIETYLATLETAQKPWFLSSMLVYGWVKATAASIPHSQVLFDQSILGITALTSYIKDKTKANVLVFDLEKASELICKLDGVLSDQFIRLDDGFDSLRGKLGMALRQLISSLVEHKQIVLKYLAEKALQLNQAGEEASTAVKTRYEKAQEVFTALLAATMDKYQPYYATLEAKKAELTQYADQTVKSNAAHYYSALFTHATYLLKTAQPYVHDAVARSSPYISTAVEVSQPYVVQAKPYLEPLLLKAQNVKSHLQEHSLVGPYVTRAEQLVLEIGTSAFEEAKIYCNCSCAPAPQVAVEREEKEEKVSAFVDVPASPALFSAQVDAIAAD